MVLINELKAGIEPAWEKFYKECYPKVKAMLLHKGCSVDNINDLFQDAMAIFYNRLVFGNPNDPAEVIHSPYAFVKRITFNLFLKLIRDKKSTVELSETFNDTVAADDALNADEETEEFLSNQALYKPCWERLEENCIKILELFYFYKMRDKITAEKLGFKNADSVKATRSKCMRHLRACIGKNKK